MLWGLRLAIFAASALAIWGGYKYVDSRLEHHYGDPIRAAWKAKDDERIKAQTAIILTYTALLNKSDDDARRQRGEADAKFQSLAQRANSLSDNRGCVVDNGALSLYGDATSAANSARTDSRTEARANSVSVPAEGQTFITEREWANFVVAAGAAYADAYGQWKYCRQREDAFLETFKKGIP